MTVSCRVQCGKIEFPLIFCIHGIGIAMGVPRAYAINVERGELGNVLPEWSADRLVVSATIPNRMAPAKNRLFVDFFGSKMKWAQSEYG